MFENVRSRIADLIAPARSHDEFTPLRERLGLGELLTGGTDQSPNRAYGNYYSTSVPVYRAVTLRANAVARAPLKIYKRDKDGNREWVGADHEVQRLVDRVNGQWTRAGMWRAVETYLGLWGSSFRWVSKPTASVDTWEIWPMRPDMVQVLKKDSRDPASPVTGFIWDPYGARFPMLPEEVIWDRYFNPLDSNSGLSPIAAARLTLDMQRDMLMVNRNLFKNGVLAQNLAFFLHGPISEVQLKEFYQRLDDRHRGVGKANRPIVIDQSKGDMKNMGFSNREMEFLEGLRFSLEDTSRAYGVPPPLMFEQSRSIYNNVSEARRDFYENTMTQEWDMLGSNMNEHLMPMLPGKFSDLEAVFDLSEIEALQENMTERAERDRLDVQAGIKTINEVRQGRGDEPLSWGDDWWKPFSLLPADADATTPPGGRSVITLKARELPAPNRAMTVAMKEMTWQSFVRRLDPHEKRFDQVQRDLFAEQQEAVLKAVRRNFRAIDPGGVFKPDDWIARYAEVGMSLFANALQTSAEAQISEFSLGINFELSEAFSQAWLDQRVGFWTQTVNEGTAKLLLEELQEANLAGESITKVRARVEKVFDFNDKIRSERIARTEMLAASNQGHLEAYRQSGIERKEWLTTLDGRQRDTHAEADGQIVDVEQDFRVGAGQGPAPGQINLVEEIVNCRCTTLPVIGTPRALAASASDRGDHRCPKCNHLLDKGGEVRTRYCRWCKEDVTA